MPSYSANYRYSPSPRITAPRTSEHRFFKMLESQWADALVTRGEIRITTIDRCRSAEAGYGRSDSSENMLYPRLRSAMTRIIPEGHESEQIEVLQSADLKIVLEIRIRGIHISAITESLVITRDGHRIEYTAHMPLHLYCAWLMTRSSLP